MRIETEMCVCKVKWMAVITFGETTIFINIILLNVCMYQSPGALALFSYYVSLCSSERIYAYICVRPRTISIVISHRFIKYCFVMILWTLGDDAVVVVDTRSPSVLIADVNRDLLYMLLWSFLFITFLSFDSWLFFILSVCGFVLIQHIRHLLVRLVGVVWLSENWYAAKVKLV